MPVRQLGLMVNAFARASMSGARLFEVLDREPDIADRPGARDLVVTDAVLRFEHVSFAYPGEGPRAADAARHQLRGARRPDARHRRPAGQRQVDDRASDPALLRRRRRPDHDRRPGHPRRHPGVAAPDASAWSSRTAFLFTASIENNIAYGDPWADRERIAQSSEVARLHDYIAGLPKGYETLVGERGVSLSGGQRQRLSIARSILLAPPILVFDDSTAAIDAATEQGIREALRTADRDPGDDHHRAPPGLAHGRRRDPVPRAGRIVERGTPRRAAARWAAATPASMRCRAWAASSRTQGDDGRERVP